MITYSFVMTSGMTSRMTSRKVSERLPEWLPNGFRKRARTALAQQQRALRMVSLRRKALRKDSIGEFAKALRSND